MQVFTTNEVISFILGIGSSRTGFYGKIITAVHIQL
jgi:hypothetical protein